MIPSFAYLELQSEHERQLIAAFFEEHQRDPFPWDYEAILCRAEALAGAEYTEQLSQNLLGDNVPTRTAPVANLLPPEWPPSLDQRFP